MGDYRGDKEIQTQLDPLFFNLELKSEMKRGSEKKEIELDFFLTLDRNFGERNLFIHLLIYLQYETLNSRLPAC
jgi:hypothetical protein